MLDERRIGQLLLGALLAVNAIFWQRTLGELDANTTQLREVSIELARLNLPELKSRVKVLEDEVEGLKNHKTKDTKKANFEDYANSRTNELGGASKSAIAQILYQAKESSPISGNNSGRDSSCFASGLAIMVDWRGQGSRRAGSGRGTNKLPPSR